MRLGSLRAGIALLFLLAASATAGGPQDAVAAAARDIVRQPAKERQHLRYLSLYAVPVKDQARAAVVLDFWLNSLSDQAELARAHRVAPDLLRIDVTDYGKAFAKAWEALSTVEPWFYDRVQRRSYMGSGKWKTVAVVALAPWLEPKSAAVLAAASASQSPIVRGDWWLVQTGQQVDRTLTGYYDFLGVKDRAGFQALVGLDEKLAVRMQKETRAALARSGVALNNRGIVRFQTVTGAYWASLDTINNKDRRNALQNLNGDLQHDAEEIYGTGSNGLFRFFLSDAKGVKQDVVPDNIASDGTAPGNDRRIHFVGCVRCHLEGIRPINDWVRKVYKAPLVLTVVGAAGLSQEQVKEKAKRLRRLYLSDLAGRVADDQRDYAKVLFGLTKLKPAELAKAYGKMHEAYAEGDLFLKDGAIVTGYPAAQIKTVLRAVAKFNPPLLPDLVGWIATPEEGIRQEHAEQAFPVLMAHLRGLKTKE